MPNGRNKVMEEASQKIIPIIPSRGSVGYVEQGFRIAAEEKLKITSIFNMAMNKQFLNVTKGEPFLVSVKNAVDENGELLKEGYYKVDRQNRKLKRSTWDEVKELFWDGGIYVSKEAAEVLKKTKEDGQERLVAFGVADLMVFGIINDDSYGREWLGVFSGQWYTSGARVAGEAMPSSEAGTPETVEKKKLDKIRSVKQNEIVSLKRKDASPVRIAGYSEEARKREIRSLKATIRKYEGKSGMSQVVSGAEIDLLYLEGKITFEERNARYESYVKWWYGG